MVSQRISIFLSSKSLIVWLNITFSFINNQMDVLNSDFTLSMKVHFSVAIVVVVVFVVVAAVALRQFILKL